MSLAVEWFHNRSLIVTPLGKYQTHIHIRCASSKFSGSNSSVFTLVFLGQSSLHRAVHVVLNIRSQASAEFVVFLFLKNRKSSLIALSQGSGSLVGID